MPNPTCAICHDPLRYGHLLVAQARNETIILCTVCKALDRVRTGLQLEETRKRQPTVTNADMLSQENATRMIVAWAETHDNILPETRYFGKGHPLPSINAVRRIWGTLVKARQAVRKAYPHLLLPNEAPWSPARIARVMEEWICTHGRLPLNADLKHDTTLPCPSIVYTHYTGLKAFYEEFQGGQHAEAYNALERQARSEAGRRGAVAARRASKRRAAQEVA